jgi:hypothetical protein
MENNKCSKKKIIRVDYTYIRKKTGKKINVKPTCINDQEKLGKGPKLITMPSYDVGLLSDYGYSLKNSHEQRIKAIRKSMKIHSELKILRHINALRTLHKSHKSLFNKLDKDMKWIQNDYMKQK